MNSLEKGGRTKRIVEEYLGLKDLGHQVQLVSFLPPPNWVTRHYSCSKQWTIIEKSWLKFDLVLIYRLLRFLISVKAQVINSHCESSSFYSGLVARLYSIPSVGTIHRSQLRYYSPSWRNRLFYRFLNHYIAVSNERKGRLVEQLGLNKDSIQVIQWGVDLEPIISDESRNELRKKLNLTTSTLLFSSGHLGPIKGHDDSIVALSLLKPKFPGIRLYIAGDGESEDHERLHSLIEKHNLQGSVILLGQITNVLEWMRVCDIFLQPSREEAFGLVFLEAGMCGKPTVSTKVGGIPEIIDDGVSGILVEPHSPAQIAKSIEQLLHTEDGVAEMGLQARESVAKNFQLSDKVAQLETHFEFLVQSH